MFDFFRQEKLHEQPDRLDICRGLAEDIMLSLQELHGCGLIHKDLKLENIVLDEETLERTPGVTAKSASISNSMIPFTPSTNASRKILVKLIDFDTVEIYKPGHKGVHVMGTDQYIAPESYAGLPGPPCDMWAFGVILYTMLTGTFPFHYALFDDEKGENYVGHEKMDRIRRRLRLAKIDWSNKTWHASPAAKNFVRYCFICNSEKRMTLKEAAQQPWITGASFDKVTKNTFTGSSSGAEGTK